MRIIHRVFFRYREELRARLQDIGLDEPADPVVLDIDEDDSRWPAVRSLLEEYGFGTTCVTRFTQRELRAASWLEMLPSWHHGYPMSDHDFGYLNLSYDLADYCEKCGVGARQKAPFRMRGEPRWGTRAMMQLNWVFDEFFARPEVWKAVFAPLGIECWPVLAYRKETELKTVVQLQISAILDSELDMKDHPFEVCPDCRRKKYLPFSRGMFPAMSRPPEGVHAIKSMEWFGSGASASRAVLVSRTLFEAISGKRVKGVQFAPLEPAAPKRDL